MRPGDAEFKLRTRTRFLISFSFNDVRSSSFLPSGEFFFKLLNRLGDLVIRCWLVRACQCSHSCTLPQGDGAFNRPGDQARTTRSPIIPALAGDKPAKRAVGFLGDFRTYSARFIRFNESAAVGIAGTVIGRNEFGFVAGVSDACRGRGCQRCCFSQGHSTSLLCWPWIPITKSARIRTMAGSSYTSGGLPSLLLTFHLMNAFSWVDAPRISKMAGISRLSPFHTGSRVLVESSAYRIPPLIKSVIRDFLRI